MNSKAVIENSCKASTYKMMMMMMTMMMMKMMMTTMTIIIIVMMTIIIVVHYCYGYHINIMTYNTLDYTLYYDNLSNTSHIY